MDVCTCGRPVDQSWVETDAWIRLRICSHCHADFVNARSDG